MRSLNLLCLLFFGFFYSCDDPASNNGTSQSGTGSIYGRWVLEQEIGKSSTVEDGRCTYHPAMNDYFLSDIYEFHEDGRCFIYSNIASSASWQTDTLSFSLSGDTIELYETQFEISISRGACNMTTRQNYPRGCVSVGYVYHEHILKFSRYTEEIPPTSWIQEF